MALDSATLGKTIISGCQLRDETGDYAGGVTLPQIAAVIENNHGVKVELHVGANACSPEYGAAQLRYRRPTILQGNTQPSGRGNVNHAIEVNDVWGGTLARPDFAAVLDPWSSGVAPWPWTNVLAFAAALRPYGEQDSRLLGPGKFYAGFLPHIEPHLALWTGARKTVPYPDRQVVNRAHTSVRLGPSTVYKVQAHRKVGDIWTAYQYKPNGGVRNGTRGWYGNIDGNRWIHESDLIGRGGSV